jgi:hypothetical protein
MRRRITDARRSCLDTLEQAYRDEPVLLAQAIEELDTLFDNLDTRLGELWRTQQTSATAP